MKSSMKFQIGVLSIAAAVSACAPAPKQEITFSPAPTIGADSSGGADEHSIYYQAAWFLNSERTIRVCYEVDPSFEGPRAKLAEQITSAFDQWKRYYESKVDLNYPGAPAASQRRFSGFSFKTSVVTAPVGGCKASSPDLTIYFGVENPEVKAVRRSTSVGFVNRTELEDDWHRGFMWVSGSKWVMRDEDAVYATLLHELGHIYGCGHYPGTVMDEKIVDYITWTAADEATNEFKKTLAEIRHVVLTKIDSDRELVRGNTLDYQISGKSCRTPNGEICGLNRLFEEISGRKPVGKVRVRLYQRDNHQIVYAERAVFRFTDDDGSVDVTLKLSNWSDFNDQQQAFKVLMLGKEENGRFPNEYTSYQQLGGGMVWKGELITDQGKQLEIEMTFNSAAVGNVFSRETSGFSPLSVVIRPPTSEVVQFYMQRTDWN